MKSAATKTAKGSSKKDQKNGSVLIHATLPEVKVTKKTPKTISEKLSVTANTPVEQDQTKVQAERAAEKGKAPKTAKADKPALVWTWAEAKKAVTTKPGFYGTLAKFARLATAIVLLDKAEFTTDQLRAKIEKLNVDAVAENDMKTMMAYLGNLTRDNEGLRKDSTLGPNLGSVTRGDEKGHWVLADADRLQAAALKAIMRTAAKQ